MGLTNVHYAGYEDPLKDEVDALMGQYLALHGALNGRIEVPSDKIRNLAQKIVKRAENSKRSGLSRRLEACETAQGFPLRTAITEAEEWIELLEE